MATLNALRKHPVIDLILTVAVAIGIAYLVQAFIVKPYRVPSGSMEPTIAIGERIIAARFTFRFSDPTRNQIIVFHPNGVGDDVYDTDTASDQTFVKRLIGMPGEVVGAVDGRVYICTGQGPQEGQEIVSTPDCSFPDQLFVSSPQDDFGPTAIPADRYFMMGDNRADSDDSRNWGPITRDQMIGVTFMSYWPPSRISIW
ncbi:MAG: signal peptidase I [Thermoleophilia bacterium]|nr:signal peptidase I [Thermoleophilia bacterium]